MQEVYFAVIGKPEVALRETWWNMVKRWQTMVRAGALSNGWSEVVAPIYKPKLHAGIQMCVIGIQTCIAGIIDVDRWYY